jgi:hypothetical protein
MSARKEHRDAAAMSRAFSDQIREIQNNNDARALFWRDLMNEGHILTFKHEPTHSVFTAGKYQTATGGYKQFALLWSGAIPRNMRDWHGLQAWDIALRIIQHVGRQRPVMIDGEKVSHA